ncbi:MAG: ATP synthase F1 subunit gamma [Saprospiraceae bacterium]|nr:ATP synthase F1 subunit gamma [Saprospiraceae bacterium]
MAGGLKEVRERITSVNSTQQITKAMKMVSAAKLKKASDSILQMRPYTLKLQEMLGNVLGSLGEGEDLGNLSFAQVREPNNVLIVLVTSDRGLCGAFNSNLIKKAKALIEDKYASKTISLMTIGKKGFDAFKAEAIDIDDRFITLFSDLSFDNSRTASEYIMQTYLDGKYDVIEVVFGEFKNAAVQYIKAEQFLPVVMEKPEQKSAKHFQADYIFEPQKQALLEKLVPKILKTQFHRYLLDNNASEHGARMMAMDQATENANELKRELKISYNRARQAAITTEISEIVSGAAALG